MQREGSGENELEKAITVNLHGKRIACTDALSTCPNLRSLDLSFNLVTKAEG